MPAVDPPTVAPNSGIDWRSVLMLPPSRRFTPEELARALPQGLSRTFITQVLVNVALPVVLLIFVFGRGNSPQFGLIVASFAALMTGAGLLAWRDPGSRVAQAAAWVLPCSLAALGGALARLELIDRVGLLAAAMVAMVSAMALWMTLVHRYQYVAMRLAELAERDRAIEMAQRLAAAQMEPHFLFNTLASVQHWVQTNDPRAAPLLQSLTHFLRSTLPMFRQPLVPLASELDAVRSYLEVMQARLGARLAFEIDLPRALQAVQLPPGLVLTLAENAVEHGIEPQIAGGRLRIVVRQAAGEVLVEVADSGPGPLADAAEGVGLANCRERLALAFGPRAQITLAAAPLGGGLATLRLPSTAAKAAA
jgi:hypothetical protein